MSNESARAIAAETSIYENMSDERARAFAAEFQCMQGLQTETQRSTQADVTLLQNQLLFSQSQAADRTRAIAAEVSLAAALNQTNAVLTETQKALVLSQNLNAVLQYNNSMINLALAQMHAVAVCSARGMFAAMDGVCFTASTSQLGGSGTCSNASSVVLFPDCKPGFAPQSHTTPTCGDANGVYPTSFTCTGYFSRSCY